MSKVLRQLNYVKIVRDLKAIIARGAANIERVVKDQTIETSWEFGRYLKEKLPFDENPSANNARIIERLAQEFDRPENYFYALIKFYKLYPRMPVNGWLSWSHYEVLLRIDDPAARLKYQQRATTKRISAKNLYGMISNDKATDSAGGAPCAPLSYVRGRLYHYRVAAPKDAESNSGVATLDAGFSIFRDIPLSKKSKLHVGHMVRTVRSEESTEIFCARVANDKKDRLYTYVAAVERVVDGDTLIVTIDLGLKTKTLQRLRLRGIDAPELTTPRGKHAKDFVKKLLDKQEFIIVKTYKDDKYGRMLADVFYLANEKDPAVVVERGTFLNAELVDLGYAQIYGR